MRNDDTDVGEELVVQEDFVLEELIEELIVQVDDDVRDTAPMDVPRGMRMATSSEWPPVPPPPAELAQGTIQHGRMSASELAEGTLGGDGGGVDIAEGTIEGDYDLAEETIYGTVAPVRRAAIYAAVRRPTTSSEDT